MKKIVIGLPPEKNIYKYNIQSAIRLFDGNQIIEMKENRLVSIELIRQVGTKWRFHYVQLNHNRTSTNNSFFDFTDILNSLFEDVYIITDKTGEIVHVNIVNQKEREKNFYKTLKKNYKDREGYRELISYIEGFFKDEQAILKQFNKNGHYKLIFGGLAREYELGQIAENKPDIIEQFAAGFDVPYLYNMNISEDESNHVTIRKEGELDYNRFDKKGFNRWLKDKTNIFNLRVDYHFELEENYIFRSDSTLTQSNTYISFLAANLYSVTMAYQIDLVEEEILQEETRPNNWIIARE